MFEHGMGQHRDQLLLERILCVLELILARLPPPPQYLPTTAIVVTPKISASPP
jgi:hypothetical protein